MAEASLGGTFSNARCPKPSSGAFWKLMWHQEEEDQQENHHPPQHPEADEKAAEHPSLLDSQAVLYPVILYCRK
jgi:hypothetical protein